MYPSVVSAQPRAWVDESGSDQNVDAGTYILAAAIDRAGHCSVIRDRMTRLRLPGQVKLHWRDEDERRRSVIAMAVAASELELLAVVRTGAPGERIERRRRKCLEQLIFELEAIGVTDVVLESHGPADDRRDIQLLNALRGRRAVAPVFRITHEVGRLEPMLWIPDAVCGAVTSSRRGNHRHQAALGERLVVRQFEV